MTLLNRTILPLLLLISITSCKKEQNKPDKDIYILKGTTIQTTTDTVHLFLPHEDFSFDPGIKIPVVNNMFEQQLDFSNSQAFYVMTDEQIKAGGGAIQKIFIEPGITELILHDEENFASNRVVGGASNKAYDLYRKDITNNFYDKMSIYYQHLDTLRQASTYGTKAYYDIIDKKQKATDPLEEKYYYTLLDSLKKIDQYYTPKAAYYENKIDSINKAFIAYKYDYINAHNDILSYDLLFESVIYDEDYLDYQRVYESFSKYEKNFPNHSYTSLVNDVITGKQNGAVGKKFIDFTAPMLNGSLKTVSKLIEGKVAILDLWATWCGPCIAKSKKLIPVYEEYKDRGFTVVGVANEYDNTDNLEAALAKYKYPWVNLVELDKAQNIWQQYGIRGGGALFLIDYDGTIVAVDPSPYEVSEFLKKRTVIKQ